MEDTYARVSAVTLRGDTVILTVKEADAADMRRFRLTLAHYKACGAYRKGSSLSQDALEHLAEKSAESEAILAAERALAASPKSARALYRNLRSKHHAHEHALSAVQIAGEKGWLREEDQLSRLVPYLAERKLWGKRKLLPYLAAKGYGKAEIEHAITVATDTLSLDFDALRSRLLETHEPQNEAEKKKLLYLHGFDVYTED